MTMFFFFYFFYNKTNLKTKKTGEYMHGWRPRMISVNEEGWLAAVANDKLMIFKPKDGIKYILYAMSDCYWKTIPESFDNGSTFERLVFKENRCYIYKTRFNTLYFANINVLCITHIILIFFAPCEYIAQFLQFLNKNKNCSRYLIAPKRMCLCLVPCVYVLSKLRWNMTK